MIIFCVSLYNRRGKSKKVFNICQYLPHDNIHFFLINKKILDIWKVKRLKSELKFLFVFDLEVVKGFFVGVLCGQDCVREVAVCAAPFF